MTTNDTITIASPPDSRIRSGLRSYAWQGRDLPSVTSVQRMAGIPHQLHQWAVSQVVARATSEVSTLNAMLNRERRPRERALESNRLDEASRWLRGAATEERDRSAAIGSAVHDAIANGLSPDDIPDELNTIKDGIPVTVDGVTVRARVEQFLDWRRVSGATVLAQEFQVFNLTAGYAGSADMIVGFPSGRVALVDLKTGSGVFSEHAIQVRAYMEGEFVGLAGEVDEATTAILRSVTDLGILHLAEDHWEYLALRDDPESGEAFRGLLRFAMWMAAHRSIDPCVSGRRSNRTCPVCGEPMEGQTTIRKLLQGGKLRSVPTHPSCTPGEESKAA